ncbi:sporulation-specific N-acetylmuramoyl-L-alanine amidase [Marinithermofilum abyssi]|uniref:Sporulation-specific N-acetylmuramoyl-L-alanine amidase n=1 Tax=Marinithermofilum abyssi TaxID=1571185 RepID=A0A8J2VGV4_9BACL|nr:N-acetylmuramoyl-L-alanine amidase [Marinithermofilum abyssi]GGE09913.1 sporulation-specific N-acetylmuramoyl-L-alanine amidase [Marinithermofilum abyssi]
MALVVIDPGHGGSDAGAVNGSYKEKNFTLDIGLRVRDYLLTRYQVNMVMTCTSDTYPTLSERVALANSKNADYFCSIHINAGGGTGWESYIYDGSVSQKTVNCRETIHNHVMSVIGPKYGVKNRGKKRANFYVLRETNMPAVLLENLFIDSADLKLLTNSGFIQDLSNAIGEGIAKALDLPAKTLYKVIAGSYKEEANAKDLQKYLKSKGIDSIIWTVHIDGTVYYRVQAGAFQSLDYAQQRLEELKRAGIPDAYILKTD